MKYDSLKHLFVDRCCSAEVSLCNIVIVLHRLRSATRIVHFKVFNFRCHINPFQINKMNRNVDTLYDCSCKYFYLPMNALCVRLNG